MNRRSPGGRSAQASIGTRRAPPSTTFCNSRGLPCQGWHGVAALTERLQESCFNAWKKYGAEPETYNIHTLEVGAPFYLLRPEIVESIYYLQRFTRDDSVIACGRFSSAIDLRKGQWRSTRAGTRGLQP